MEESKQKTIELAYLILRLSLGINMFLHGLVRIPKIDGFQQWVVGQFSDTILPESLVSISAYMIPYTELIIGFLLIIGLFTSQALIAGAVLIALLIFGSALQENWALISSQMVYSILFFILSYLIDKNRYSIDRLRKK